MPYFPPASSGGPSDKITDPNGATVTTAFDAAFGAGTVQFLPEGGSTASYLTAPGILDIYANTNVDGSGTFTPAISLNNGRVLLIDDDGLNLGAVGYDGRGTKTATDATTFQGNIALDSSYLYVSTGVDQWKRIAWTAW